MITQKRPSKVADFIALISNDNIFIAVSPEVNSVGNPTAAGPVAPVISMIDSFRRDYHRWSRAERIAFHMAATASGFIIVAFCLAASFAF